MHYTIKQKSSLKPSVRSFVREDALPFWLLTILIQKMKSKKLPYAKCYKLSTNDLVR